MTTKEEVEKAIMKENLLQFGLAYWSLLLEDNLCHDLGLLREEHLAKYFLGSQEQLQQHPEAKKVFELFHRSKH